MEDILLLERKVQFNQSRKMFIKQECIPVGCISSAAVTFQGEVCLVGFCLGGVCLGGGVCQWVSVQGGIHPL